MAFPTNSVHQVIVKGVGGDKANNVSMIANSTSGMVFLGTPFHGSPVAPFGKCISKLVSIFVDSDYKKPKVLEQKSEKLAELAESFAAALRQHLRERKEIRVSFFYETKKLCNFMVGPLYMILLHQLAPTHSHRKSIGRA
jgi:hypothetical protein